MAARNKIIPLILPEYAPESRKYTRRWATRVPTDHIRINPSKGCMVLSKSFRELVESFPYLAVGIEENTASVTFWFTNKRKEGMIGYNKNEVSNTIRTEYCGSLIDNLQKVLQISKDCPNDFRLTLSEKKAASGVIYTLPFNKTTLF